LQQFLISADDEI